MWSLCHFRKRVREGERVLNYGVKPSMDERGKEKLDDDGELKPIMGVQWKRKMTNLGFISIDLVFLFGL